MNRKMRRAINKKSQASGRTGKADLNDPVEAQDLLESLSVVELVAGINNSLDVLRRKGVQVKDWDSRGRQLYQLKAFGDRVFFLAAEPGGVKT